MSYRRPSGIDKEFFIQIFVEPHEGISEVYTQDLLNNMFLEQNISFAKVYPLIKTRAETIIVFKHLNTL